MDISCVNRKNRSDTTEGAKNDSLINNYDIIISDYSTQSYYMSLNISIPGMASTLILIQNSDLWYILNRHSSYTRTEYNKKIKEALINNLPLVLESSTYEILEKYKVDTNNCTQIPQDTALIRKKYFDNRNIIKKEFAPNKELQNCIIYTFYKNGKIVRNEDESGYLKIDD
jgi:hypothetical protein